MLNKLIVIATFLRTKHESKKHGGWDIYEDEKIKIAYDTYHPNVNVWVKIDNQNVLVLLATAGVGEHWQKYHPGAWEKYVSDILSPKAIEAKRLSDIADQQRREEERQKRFGPIDDSKVFA